MIGSAKLVKDIWNQISLYKTWCLKYQTKFYRHSKKTRVFQKKISTLKMIRVQYIYGIKIMYGYFKVETLQSVISVPMEPDMFSLLAKIQYSNKPD